MRGPHPRLSLRRVWGALLGSEHWSWGDAAYLILLRVQGSGFGLRVVGLRVKGIGFRVKSLVFSSNG